MPLPLVAIGGMTIARTLATRLGPRAISALRKMDTTKAKNLINKAKNAIKSKDTKKLENINQQIKKIDKQKGPKKEEAGPSANQLKRIKTKETKLQKEKTAIAKRKEARKKKVTSTVDLASRASLLPLIKRRKKEDKPIDKPVDKSKSESKIAPPSVLKTRTIKEDETLSQIAKSIPGVTLGGIKKANPGINLNKISIGQKINLPEEKDLSPDRKSVYEDIDISKITMKKKRGGPLQTIPAGNKGLPNLPTPVRNKMGFKKRGGKVIKKASGGLIGGGAALRGFGAIRKR
jgi:myosin heavy subunit